MGSCIEETVKNNTEEEINKEIKVMRNNNKELLNGKKL